MRSRGTWIAVAAGLLLLVGTPVTVGVRAHPMSARIARLAEGSWCWFADPRAVRVVGRRDQTFVGWIDWHGAITIGAYAPSFGLVRTRVIGWLYRDDHGSPSIFVEPDDRLTVFWSAHNGSAMYSRTTRRPEDIGSWGPIQAVPLRQTGRLGFTYPNPVSLRTERNRLYLFWRGADWSQDYATRTPAGQWSAARRLIAAAGQRPYVKVDSDGRSTVALAFTDGHPRERVTSVYYVAYRHGSLWGAGGRWIGRLQSAPIAPQRGDLVYSGPRARAPSWVWDVALGPRDRPVIVYATFRSAGNHEYWYARFDGRRWISHFMTFAGPSISPTTIEQQYSGGLALDHSDPSVVYVSRRVAGLFEIERWTTRDGGQDWRHATVVRDGADNVRPVVPRGSRGGPMSLLWLRGAYGSYSSYRTWVADEL